MGDLTKPISGPHCFLSGPLDSHIASPSCKGGQAKCPQKEETNTDSVNFSKPQFPHLQNTLLIASW